MIYDTILLDADETLFDYPAAARCALISTLSEYNFPFLNEEDIINEYQTINHEMWKKFEQEKITRDELSTKRFEILFNRYNLKNDYKAINTFYLKKLGEGSQLLPDALELCSVISKKASLYIVTNGFNETQISRVERSKIAPYINKVYTSEIIGYQKPRLEFFEKVFSDLNIKEKSRVIILGDNLSSDILGGKNAGITTCWYNPQKILNSTDKIPDFEINNLLEFIQIVN